MDSYAFDDFLATDTPSRGSRSKPVKRKWREIEALKDRQRLRRELADIDIFNDLTDSDIDF
ncbi:DUF3545 family protein [Photobacterium aphoticum]|uniref:DUF3545 domain-containing protein n=1 Tax=Photobacterium aphoticum TaxID=754436 RepID=A0A090QSU9_9GAMM|nr:DUF3545 family protein [Photobacterium aphoticum]KLV00783.1 hypothetical protein ABT58_11190 [Photobacterium aphoticum]PSU48024.1 DUF3545 domain-containing protein [Photobacterium aphoticum]GAL05961.1 hypothetical protein JCM19237_1601 [Photobacterium aphoticum]GHA51126.1 hypothetical protein GCM10007086_26360 [Photobacterium aphoticum]